VTRSSIPAPAARRTAENVVASIVVRPSARRVNSELPANAHRAAAVQRTALSFGVIKPFSKVYLLHDLGLSSTKTHSYRIRFQNGDGITRRSTVLIGVRIPIKPS